MKKVLSVAMASAMVLGMGANAFAIKYNVDSNDTAKWPKNFAFEKSLFVTDKDGNLVTSSTTAINRNSKVDFQPGDVVWMPLYADDQTNYHSDYKPAVDGTNGYTNIGVSGIHTVPGTDDKLAADTAEKDITRYGVYNTDMKNIKVKVNGKDQLPDSVTLTLNNGKEFTQEVKSEADLNTLANTVNDYLKANAKDNDGKVIKYSVSSVVATVNGTKGSDAVVGDIVTGNGEGVVTVKHGQYTGNIDKNWSVNLLESKGTTVTDFVEKAELYKADEIDAASYNGKGNVEVMPNSVFVRVHLKKEWKTCDTTNLKYYVYVADNAGNATNKVYVEGKYAAPAAKKVDFTWSNDASVASLWKAEENGVAVFDFQDKAFFTVKMYKGECLYLDLDAAYKLATAREFDGEIDSFYYFDKENANFFREGELVIVSDNDELNVYEVTADGAEHVDAEYVKGHAVAHTNQKVNGYVFNTKELGNYVLAEGVEEEEVIEDVEEEVPEEVEEEEEAPSKVNPDTGANDFVGLAVSLAVVSVAAAGALALKK